MRFTLYLTLLLSCFVITTDAQITTPGTGVSWDADAFVQAYPNAINEYYEDGERIWEIEEDLFIASGDSVLLDSINIHLGDTATIESKNAAILFKELNFIGLNSDTFPRMRFDSSRVLISGCTFNKGGGIDFIDAIFAIEHSEFTETFHLEDGVGAAVSLFRSIGRIENSRFEKTTRPALGSGLNGSIGVVVDSCTFIENNTDNENAAQLNFGTSAPADTIVITNNTIIGKNDNVGGIAIANFSPIKTVVLVENNRIEDNRYGVTMTGINIISSIQNNQIIGNDIQGNPSIGGSGVNLFGDESNRSFLGGNIIEDNLWGLTIQASDADEGIAPIAYLSEPDGEDLPFPTTQNAFINNGNNGELYALFNMNDTTIYARGNFWGTTDSVEIENRIVHKNDDPALGEVIYEDFLLKHPDSTMTSSISPEHFSMQQLHFYPNPVKQGERIVLKDNLQGAVLKIYDLRGRNVEKYDLSPTENLIRINVKSGMYQLMLKTKNGKYFSGSMIVQ